jgi:hypothetical protein
MPSTETLIQGEIDKDELHIQRAVERGGLPAESEAATLYKTLGDITEMLEGIAFRVGGIALADMGEDVPEITLEQLGVLAIIIDDVASESNVLAGYVDQLRRNVSSLNANRAAQQHDLTNLKREALRGP